MLRSTSLAVVLLIAAGACVSTSREAAPPAARTSAPDTTSTPAFDLSDPLPLNPDVRTGTLDNGLRYYILRNTEPARRAELRLAVDAGSVLETENERGLAHFLEHLLFNGTRRFPETALVDFLERTGMRFGPDINAYTSFDETVYMLQVPTDSAWIVETAFDVLEDWAAYATLSPEEIEKERGVIVAEWRERDENYQGRLREQTLPVLLHGSHYKDRLPIGLPDVIRTLPADSVRAFYERWYRPEHMAVVAVGDFDPDRIEALIHEHFAGLPTRGAAPERRTFDVPGHDETLYAVATDPELPFTSVSVYYKQPTRATETVADYRELLVRSLFNGMLNERLAEIARSPGAPFVGASVLWFNLVRPAEVYGIGAQVQDDSVLVGLEAILTEAARAREHGFTTSELERQKRETLRAYERAFEERENTHSSAYADELVSHFLEGEAAPGIAYEYALVRRHLPEITLDEVNARAADLLAEQNRAVIVQMPEKPGVDVPTEDDLAAVLQAVRQKPVAAYEDDVTDQPLLAEIPQPAAITSEQTIDTLGVTELTLANGVRVVMKPTDFKQDEVRFTAFSPGGSSLVPDDVVVEADLAATLIDRSGVGPFTLTELQKMLAGKVVGVTPYIGEREEGFSGSASPQDLETLFQLVHLYFTAPRADTAALATVQNQVRAYLANRAANPVMVFQDSLQAALYGDHPRRRRLTIEDVDRLDLAEAFSIYRDRFADASDFTFIFVGNFDVDSLKTLAATYLGTLPATSRRETWRDVYPALPEGVVTKTVRKGIGQQSRVLLMFHGPLDFNRQTRHAVRSLADVLDIMLREALREELGGVYGVDVSASTSSEPDSTYSLVINFTTDPARVDELIDATFAAIEKLKAEGPEPDTVEKVREQQRRERETALETNAFWLGILDYYYSQEAEPLLDVLRYNELIEALDAEDIRQAARTYLNEAQYVRAVLMPEG